MDQLLQEPLPKLPENRTHPASSASSSGRLEFNAFSNSLKSAQEVSAAFDLVIAQGELSSYLSLPSLCLHALLLSL